ncbi:MAG: N-acetyl-gamma-glutamyl-phosphate reductase [Planctomycetota bacterium]
MNAASDLRIGVLGASGYIGAELLRYIAGHPRAKLAWASAHSRAGERVDTVLPNLAGFIDGTFCDAQEAESRLGEVDAIFVALPHNQSQEVIPRIAAAHPDLLVIDMAGDFRTNDPAGYAKFYKKEHQAPELLSKFVYGFTEFQRDALKSAKLIANPGCFATAMLVACSPLAKAGVLKGDVVITGITGSSGSGNKPIATTHHPERFSNLRSYKPLSHQHLLEVESFLRTLTSEDFRLQFVPQSGPIARGIFATVVLPDRRPEDLNAIYESTYESEALITVRSGSPELRWVQGTPRTFVGVAGADERGSAVFSVIDNLGKGAASQGIQNLNVASGLPETEGLMSLPGGYL